MVVCPWFTVPSMSLLLACLVVCYSRLALGLSFQEDALPGWMGDGYRMDRSTPGMAVPHVETLSWSPRAFVHRNFLTNEECDYLVNLARPRLTRSEVVAANGTAETDDVRTSYGMFFEMGETDIIKRIEERVARWTFLPVENQEAMQVLRYGIGQKYSPHTDYFEKEAGISDGGMRYATVLMYLSDVALGGETAFPSAKDPFKHKKDNSWSDCGKSGLAVKPRKGDALLFFSLSPNAQPDEMSLHTGCPVIKGEKWSATKWIHVSKYEEGESDDPSAPCADRNDSCEEWANSGECASNPKYMLHYCKKSCGKCAA